MSETCYYHPEAKAKSTCPECTMAICDRCRLEGDMQRCGTCASFYADGGSEMQRAVPAAAPPAVTSQDEFAQPMCTNHANLAADMQCLNCFRPFCLSCASTGYCPDCAPQFVSRQGAAQMASSAPPPAYETHDSFGGYDQSYAEQGYDAEPGMDTGFDLAGSYMNDEVAAPPPPPRPKPRKKPQGGAKKGAPAKGGAKKGAPAKKPAKKSAGTPMGPIIGGLVVVLALGGGGYWFMTHKGADASDAPVAMKAKLTSPKGTNISGPQTIKVKVESPDEVDHVELSIDGRQWGMKLKDPPFESDWPTGLSTNGKHKVVAKVFYKGGKTVSDAHEYVVKNKL